MTSTELGAAVGSPAVGPAGLWGPGPGAERPRPGVLSALCTPRALVQTRDFRWCCIWLQASPEERSVLAGAVSLTCAPAGSDGLAASAAPDTPQQRPNWRPSQENWECPGASEENPPHSLLAEGCHLREPGLPQLCYVAGLALPASVSLRRPFVTCLEVLSRALGLLSSWELLPTLHLWTCVPDRCPAGARGTELNSHRHPGSVLKSVPSREGLHQNLSTLTTRYRKIRSQDSNLNTQ